MLLDRVVALPAGILVNLCASFTRIFHEGFCHALFGVLPPVLISTNITEITNRIHVLNRVMRYYKRGQHWEDEHINIPVQQGMRLLRQPLR